MALTAGEEQAGSLRILAHNIDRPGRLQTLHDLLIRTPGGAYTPLREIATVKRGRAYTTIDLTAIGDDLFFRAGTPGAQGVVKHGLVATGLPGGVARGDGPRSTLARPW